MVYAPPQHKAQVLLNNNNESFMFFFTDETKRSQKKFYLIYFSHPEFIPVEADGEGAKPGRKQTSGSTAGAARWKQTDLHVCVDAGSEISVFTFMRLTHSDDRSKVISSHSEYD